MSRMLNKLKLSLMSVAIACLLSSCAGDSATDVGTTYKLYFLGGQSNMDGYGQVSELPAELNAPVSGVRIFHGNTVADDSSGGGRGIWSELRPGHGVGFSSDGVENAYSARFGVEQTFALRLRELNPEAKIAIVKYSRGGTSIDSAAAGGSGSWDPDYGGGDGVNQYDHFLTAVRNAMSVSDIDGDGKPDDLVPAGIVWMQGESDAEYTQQIAGSYRHNLTRLMGMIRTAFQVDDLPVVIGRISDSGQDESGRVWDHGDIIREAQAAFVESDSAAALVTSTDDYSYSDPYHYDTAGYIELGRVFAEAVVGIERE
jgi:carbohydrate esterase-like sialic acid-specific acetylesterase